MVATASVQGIAPEAKMVQNKMLPQLCRTGVSRSKNRRSLVTVTRYVPPATDYLPKNMRRGGTRCVFEKHYAGDQGTAFLVLHVLLLIVQCTTQE